MPKTPRSLCSNHACPAIDACTRYLSHHVAGRDTSYFRPVFDGKNLRSRVNTSHDMEGRKPMTIKDTVRQAQDTLARMALQPTRRFVRRAGQTVGRGWPDIAVSGWPDRRLRPLAISQKPRRGLPRRLATRSHETHYRWPIKGAARSGETGAHMEHPMWQMASSMTANRETSKTSPRDDAATLTRPLRVRDSQGDCPQLQMSRPRVPDTSVPPCIDRHAPKD